MAVTVITPPEPVVTLEEAKAHLDELSADKDPLILLYIEAATAQIDGPTGWLGCCIGTQTIEERFDDFGCDGEVRLTYGPVQSVTSVKYIASDGTETTVSGADYSLIGGSSIYPAYGAEWPTPQDVGDAVRVRYVSGRATVPASIKVAILLMVGDLYANRETVGEGSKIPMSATVENLLAPLRVWRV